MLCLVLTALASSSLTTIPHGGPIRRTKSQAVTTRQASLPPREVQITAKKIHKNFAII
jgi:hypothetical protein